MEILDWPKNLAPSQAEFWLEPHTAANESPFTRQRQIYSLPGDRWVCSMRFNNRDRHASARMDALLAELGGRAGRIRISDFRRATPLGRIRDPFLFPFGDGTFFADDTEFEDSPPLPQRVSVTSYGSAIPVAGWMPSIPGLLLAGDYVQFGENRLHILTRDFDTDEAGAGVMHVRPLIPATYPLQAGQTVTYSSCTAVFRAKDDSGARNQTEPGLFSSYRLNFVQEVPCPAT